MPILTPLLLAAASHAAGPVLTNSNQFSPGVEQKVEKTLSSLTLEEKISLIGGTRGFYTNSIPRLGIPELKMSDGPQGVRNYGPTTSFPGMVALAAAWNPQLAERAGAAIGGDARARGVHVWLAPGVNLARIPECGRAFEYYGEDPYLAGTTAAGIIRGIQSREVVATIKHFAANNHEDDRNQDSSQADERTLRELYLRAFEIAVKEAGPWAVMCSYNKLNGTYTSEHDWLLNKVLKKQWGFRGIVMSDWGAVHSAEGAARYGMDLEMPGPRYMNLANLMPLIESGKVTREMIDGKVRRLLRLEYSLGYDQRPQEDSSEPLDSSSRHQAALEVSRQGIVLLQNRGRALPVAPKAGQKILVVGPYTTRVPQGGGSGMTEPIRTLSLVDALKKEYGAKAQVRAAAPHAGVETLAAQADYRLPDGSGPGLKVEAFSGTKLEGMPVYTGVEKTISHNWTRKNPYPGLAHTNYSVRWTGTFTPKTTDDYLINAVSDDGIKVVLGGKTLVDDWFDRSASPSVNTIRLEAGKPYSLKVEFYQAYGDSEIHFGLAPFTQALELDAPLRDLKSADVVVAAFGLDNDLESEGMDRSFELPFYQRALLNWVIRHSGKVVLVNYGGGPVDLAPYVGRIPAILQAWYPGGVGSQAIAEVMSGRVNPSGKLPTTFPKTLKGTYYADAYPPVNHVVKYKEGLEMGYRWFDAHGVKALFPFGYGLSYTTFKLSGLKAAVGSRLSVAVTVKNTGSREGSEVVQIYARRPGEKFRILIGFAKVTLKAGASKKVALELPWQNAAVWTQNKGWQAAPGSYVITAGDSIESQPLKASLTLSAARASRLIAPQSTR